MDIKPCMFACQPAWQLRLEEAQSAHLLQHTAAATADTLRTKKAHALLKPRPNQPEHAAAIASDAVLFERSWACGADAAGRAAATTAVTATTTAAAACVAAAGCPNIYDSLWWYCRQCSLMVWWFAGVVQASLDAAAGV